MAEKKDPKKEKKAPEEEEEDEHECPQGAPSWVMTFADLVTLLMVFFILLFAMGSIEEEKLKQIKSSMRDALGRAYATGKRKDAVARVWIKPGSGKVVVNGKEMNAYFARPVLQMILRQPFQVAGVVDQFDVNATVKGGGLSGQAGAVKHGISKALILFEPGDRKSVV